MEGISNIVSIGLWLFGGFAVIAVGLIAGFVVMTKRHALRGE